MLTHSEAGSPCEGLRRAGCVDTPPCQSQRFKDDATPDTDRSNGGAVPSLLNFVDDAGRDIREALVRSAPGRRLVDHRRYLQRQLRCRNSHSGPVVSPSYPDTRPATAARSTSGGDKARRFRCSQADCLRDKPTEVTPAMTKAMLDKRVSSAQPEAEGSCGSRNGAGLAAPCCHWPTEDASHDSSRSARGGYLLTTRRDEHPADRLGDNVQLLATMATTDCTSATHIVPSNRNKHTFNNAEITNTPLLSENTARGTDTPPQPVFTGSRNYSPGSDSQSDSSSCVSVRDRGTTGGIPVKCQSKYYREGHDDNNSSCSGQKGNWMVDGPPSNAHTKVRALPTEHIYLHAGISFPYVCGMSATKPICNHTDPAINRLFRVTSITREERNKRNDGEDELERSKAGPDDRDVGCGCHYTDKRKAGTEENNRNDERDSLEHPSQIPLRQRHLPASFWKEPNVPKLPPPLPPEYIDAAFYGTRKYDELSAHVLAPPQMDMLAYKHMSPYSCSGVGMSGYPPYLSDSQRPYALTTDKFYAALAASRYAPEVYASLYAAAAVDTGGGRATWTRLGNRKSPAETQSRCYISPASLAGRVTGSTSESWRCITMDYNGAMYDKTNGGIRMSVANGESARHQHVWKPIPTKSMTTSVGSRFHPFAGVR